MPFATESNKPDIYYEKIGIGTPIIFIPPPGVGHLTFHYQTALKDRYQVITFDIRGDCRSGKTSNVMTMMQLAEDVKRMLDSNNINKAIICGYSNGGCIAQEFALTFPQRTAGLILIGGYYAVKSVLLKREYQLGIWSARKKLMKAISKVLSINHFGNSPLSKQLFNEMKHTDAKMLAKQYTLGLHYSCEDRLQEMTLPLLLIYGSRDYYIHPYKFLYQKLLQDVEVVYIQGTKHQVPTKSPQECNAVIKEWILRKKLSIFN